MISRRSFLAALSCLPFVGKMIQQKVEAMAAPIQCGGCQKVCPPSKQLLWTMITIGVTPPHMVWLCPSCGLDFEAAAQKDRFDRDLAEWDQRYQA